MSPLIRKGIIRSTGSTKINKVGVLPTDNEWPMGALTLSFKVNGVLRHLSLPLNISPTPMEPLWHHSEVKKWTRFWPLLAMTPNPDLDPTIPAKTPKTTDRHQRQNATPSTHWPAPRMQNEGVGTSECVYTYRFQKLFASLNKNRKQASPCKCGCQDRPGPDLSRGRSQTVLAGIIY